MKIAVLTITSGNRTVLPLISKYVMRQTRLPDLWVVSNDHNDRPDDIGTRKYNPNEQRPIKKAVALNMLEGLSAIPSDYAVVPMEDDDWYAPTHLEEMELAFKSGQPLVGATTVAQYNVQERHWILEPVIVKRGIVHTALAWTGINVSGRDVAARVFNGCAARGMGACFRLWSDLDGKCRPTMKRTGVGIKGIPGMGVSGKHNLAYSQSKGHVWHPDPEMEKLREWIGDDVDSYAQFQMVLT